MKWVTREHPKTDRIACPWLIRKFIDPDAQIVYVPRDHVLEYAEREGATSFDAPGREVHPPRRQVLVRDDGREVPHRRSSHCTPRPSRPWADFSEDCDTTPQSPGLQAIADGFALLDVDYQRQLELELPVYDALYA